MAQRPHVPKFGDWQNKDNTPYTIYFDKARQGKTGGKMINPNDPQENPDMHPQVASSFPAEPVGRSPVRPTHQRRVSKEDNSEHSAHSDDMGHRAAGGPAQQRGGNRQPVKSSAGSEYSFERSPLHPQYQTKLSGKGGGTPSREGRNSYDSSHGTPGRSKTKTAGHGDETPNRGAAIPEFGDWEKNPSSGENYTVIFDEVRKQRTTPSTVSDADVKTSYSTERNQKAKEKGGCFPCFGK